MPPTTKEEEFEAELIIERQPSKYAQLICFLLIGIIIGVIGTITFNNLVTHEPFPDPAKAEPKIYKEFYVGAIHYISIDNAVINYTSDSLDNEATIRSLYGDTVIIPWSDQHSELPGATTPLVDTNVPHVIYGKTSGSYLLLPSVHGTGQVSPLPHINPFWFLHGKGEIKHNHANWRIESLGGDPPQPIQYDTVLNPYKWWDLDSVRVSDGGDDGIELHGIFTGKGLSKKDKALWDRLTKHPNTIIGNP